MNLIVVALILLYALAPKTGRLALAVFHYSICVSPALEQLARDISSQYGTHHKLMCNKGAFTN